MIVDPRPTLPVHVCVCGRVLNMWMAAMVHHYNPERGGGAGRDGSAARVISDYHFRKTATEYDRKNWYKVVQLYCKVAIGYYPKRRPRPGPTALEEIRACGERVRALARSRLEAADRPQASHGRCCRFGRASFYSVCGYPHKTCMMRGG
jgi:hypothetical protein